MQLAVLQQKLSDCNNQSLTRDIGAQCLKIGFN